MLKVKVNVVFLSGMESEWLVDLDKEVKVRDNTLIVDGVICARNVDFIEKEEIKPWRNPGLYFFRVRIPLFNEAVVLYASFERRQK